MNRFERQKIQEREEHMDKHSEETMDEIRLIQKKLKPSECEYLGCGWCYLSGNPCFKDTGACDTWNDILKEEAGK